MELTVAGSGPDEREFLRCSAQFLVDGRMRYVGSASNQQVQALMARSDVFVLPSAFEGLPIPLLEAMAHGLVPVSAHCRSGVDEVIQHGVNGLLVPVGDIDGFVEQIAWLAANPERLVHMGQAARHTIESGGFTIDAMADAYIALMERVVAEPFSRPAAGFPPTSELRGLRSWLYPVLRVLWVHIRNPRQSWKGKWNYLLERLGL